MPFIDYGENKTVSLKNEHDLQSEVVSYLRETDLTFCANMNGYLDTATKRIRSWQEGMSAGHPDLVIYTPNNTYKGLVFFFKRVRVHGVIINKKHDWLDKLEKDCKYFCMCSNDYAVIIECIVKFTLDAL